MNMSKRKFYKKRSFYIVLAVIIILVIYFAWLYKNPYTQNAYVVANIRPVTSFVPGYVTEIYVKNNTFVKKGDKLFSLYKVPYELNVSELTHQIDEAKARLKSLEYTISLQKFNLKIEQDKYENTLYLSKQASLLASENAVSEKFAETKFETYQEAVQAVYIANEKLNISLENYKANLAKINALENQLALAKIHLEWTSVYAETDGYPTNLFLSPGTYVSPGNVLFAFVDSSEWWVQANFEETALSNIKEGQEASIKLWQYPGKVFKGKVAATGWGVQRNSSTASGMPLVPSENEWFLLPQRYPVLIKIEEANGFQFHTGGTAWVRINVSAEPIREFFWEFLGI